LKHIAAAATATAAAVSVCATVAEVRKRGEDFWAEFEFYLSDLIVGKSCQQMSQYTVSTLSLVHRDSGCGAINLL
jgi:N-glycosylase/DNA lyase